MLAVDFEFSRESGISRYGHNGKYGHGKYKNEAK
jgi:hypothetical protein